MEDDISINPGIETIESKPETNIKDSLLAKREALLNELRELDTTASFVQQEYSAKLQELQTKRKPLEEVLYHIEALLRFEGYNVNSRQLANGDGNGADLPPETSITNAAFSLLEELHQPLHYKEIADKLQERNVYIPGKNPAATLLSRISRDSRFKRAMKRGVYALSTWRMPSTKRRRTKSRKAKNR